MSTGSLKKSIVIVYLVGLITSAVTLLLIYLFLVLFEFNITGLYILVFPVGAIMAGVVAGLGYSVSSKVFNIRVSRPQMISVFFISLVIYAAATYVTFVADTGETSLSLFLQYLKATAENSSMTIGRSSRTTIENLGGFGYALLAFEFLGFAAGATAPLFGLSGQAYCRECRAYLRPKNTFYHMPPLEKGDISQGLSAEEKQTLIEANEKALREEFEKTKPLLEGRSLEENEKTLSSLKQSEQHRNWFYLTYTITGCPQCGKHEITATLNSVGREQYTVTSAELGKIQN